MSSIIARLVAAALALAGLLENAQAQTWILSPASQSMAGSRVAPIAPFTGAVATRGRLVDTSGGGAGLQMQTKTHHVTTDTITSLQIRIPNYFVQNGVETSPGGIASVTASVEFPPGTCNAFKFSGIATGSIPNGGEILSDALTLAIPKASDIFVRIWFSAASILFSNLNGGNPVDAANGEGFEFATTTPDKTVTCAAVSSGTAVQFWPSAIIGTTTKPTICIISDSRAFGVGDVFSGTTSNLGNVERNLGTQFGFINTSTLGNSLVTYIAGHTNRGNLTQYCRNFIVGSVNDFINGQSNTQYVTNLQALATSFAPFQTFSFTEAPVTTSTDGWLTTGNQTAYGGNAFANLFNTSARAGISGIARSFELANPVSSAQNSGIWIATPTPPYTGDGTHPNQAGTALITATNPITPSVFH